MWTQSDRSSSNSDLMLRYAETNACRMAGLYPLRDLADGQKPCGICDFAHPRRASARSSALIEDERATVHRVIAAASYRSTNTTGRLHTE